MTSNTDTQRFLAPHRCIDEHGDLVVQHGWVFGTEDLRRSVKVSARERFDGEIEGWTGDHEWVIRSERGDLHLADGVTFTWSGGPYIEVWPFEVQAAGFDETGSWHDDFTDNAPCHAFNVWDYEHGRAAIERTPAGFASWFFRLGDDDWSTIAEAVANR